MRFCLYFSYYHTVRIDYARLNGSLANRKERNPILGEKSARAGYNDWNFNPPPAPMEQERWKIPSEPYPLIANFQTQKQKFLDDDIRKQKYRESLRATLNESLSSNEVYSSRGLSNDNNMTSSLRSSRSAQELQPFNSSRIPENNSSSTTRLEPIPESQRTYRDDIPYNKFETYHNKDNMIPNYDQGTSSSSGNDFAVSIAMKKSLSKNKESKTKLIDFHAQTMREVSYVIYLTMLSNILYVFECILYSFRLCKILYVCMYYINRIHIDILGYETDFTP